MKEDPEGDLKDILNEDIPEDVMRKLQKAFQSARRDVSQNCPDLRLVLAYALEKVSPEAKAQIHTHLLECQECLGLVLDTRSAWAETQEQEEEADDIPLQGHTNLLTTLAEFLAKGKENFVRLVSFPKLLPMALAASIALAIIGISIYQNREAPVGIELKIFAQSPDGLLTRGFPEGKAVLVPKDGTLQSGDKFKITFELDRDAYVYVYFHETSGKIIQLFSGETSGRKQHILPQKNDWFTLDATKGREKVYLLAASHPIDKLDDVVQKVKENKIEEVKKSYPGIAIQSFGFTHE